MSGRRAEPLPSSQQERYGGGAIEVVEYDPAWPRAFERERERLHAALGELAQQIDHVGSTAVSGLPGKPIIDLLVTIADLDAARAVAGRALPPLGYRHLAEYEVWLPGELLFRRERNGRWTHHVHLAERCSDRWNELVLIRDYLREHPKVAEAYGHLKRVAAATAEDDIAGYRRLKRPFLESVFTRASSQQSERDRHLG